MAVEFTFFLNQGWLPWPELRQWDGILCKLAQLMSFAQKHSFQNQQNNTTTRNNKMFTKCKKYLLSNVFSFLVKGSWKHELHMLNSIEALLESVMSNKNLGTNHQLYQHVFNNVMFSREGLKALGAFQNGALMINYQALLDIKNPCDFEIAWKSGQPE